MAEIPFEPYTNQGKLRFWCQKVLPLVYDDSLSYYELLNKVVEYLNNTITDVSACEDNITALRDAFVQLQDYVNEMFDDFEPEIERIIDEMIDSGEFGEILTDVVNGLIADEYSTTQGYAQFDYVLKDGKLYCATESTSGEWDASKWRETTVGADMQLLNQRVYNLNAGQVAFNESATYDANTVGKKLKDLDDFDDNLNAGQVEYNSENTYNNATVGKELQELKGSLTQNNNNIAYVENDNTASRNYIWNDYVIVNGQLYKVKTNISQGDTFTVGTNIETAYASNSASGVVAEPTIVDPTYFERISYDTQVIGDFLIGSVSLKCIADVSFNTGLVRFNMLAKPAYGWQIGIITNDQWARTISSFARCYCVANASTNNRLEIGGIPMTVGQFITIIIAMPVSKV